MYKDHYFGNYGTTITTTNINDNIFNEILMKKSEKYAVPNKKLSCNKKKNI